MRRLVPIAVLAAVAVAIGLLVTGPAGGGGSSRSASRAVDPQVAMGAHLFVQFACSACHGVQGKGGVSPFVPALQPIHKSLTVSALTTIITHGLGESANPKRPYMPVWGPVISKSQVADLVAYIRRGSRRSSSRRRCRCRVTRARRSPARRSTSAYGCINCHGPNGLGGVPNPQSADKTIPPLAGQDFRKEFNTDAKIIDVIRSGSVIGKQPIASMPHWGGIIPNRDLQALVAYLKTLK